jgi:predicted MFS family arabinose efflux permease
MTFWVAFTGQLPTLALVSLGASETLIGLQSGLQLAFQGLQLPALRLVSWFPKRRLLITGQLIAQVSSLPLLFFAAIAALDHGTAQAIVFASLVGTVIGLDLSDLVWFPLLRAYVQPERIGRFFGTIRTTWHAALILFFVGGQVWLARNDNGFGPLFGVAWLCGALRIALIARLPERSERTGERIRAREALALVRTDGKLQRYLIGICWGYGVRYASLPFAIVMLRRGLGFSNADVVVATIAQFVGGLVSLYAWGALVDRLGAYVVFRFASLGLAALYLGLAQLEGASGATHFAAIAFFFLQNVLAAGYGVADTRVLFELTPPEAPARTLVVVGVITGVSCGLAPVLAGIALDPLLARAAAPLPVYHGFFAVAALLQAASFLPLRVFRR